MQNRNVNQLQPLNLLLGVLLTLSAVSIEAATFVVSKTTDSLDGDCDTDCSLREAVVAANASPGADAIFLPAQTYTLTLPAERDEENDTIDEDENDNGDLDVHDSLTIIGDSTAETVISGSEEAHDRIFEVFAGAKLTLQQLRLNGGRTSSYGAGVENNGETVLINVNLTGNRASGAFTPGSGGGIVNRGVLSVYTSTFTGNSAAAGECCLGRGGAILNWGTMTVRDTTFASNSAHDDNDVGEGGAIYNEGTASIGGSTFVDNRGNEGAAIKNNGSGQLKIFNSTFSANQMGYYEMATIVNGSGYSKPAEAPSLQLVNVTITGSIGGYGLINFGKVLLRNSIIAGNQSEEPGVYKECQNRDAVAYKALGLLLGDGEGNCSGEIVVDSATVFSTVLYPLAQNNGITQTHGLRKNSPALDAGLGSCAATDQRGLRRPRDGTGDGVALCDLGAYERSKP